MIGYHPALDPYHTSFRILQILDVAGRSLDREAVRILDFFLVFPEAIEAIQLPREHVMWRSRLRRQPNQYWFTGDRTMVFDQMRPVQESSIALLGAAGWTRVTGVAENEIELVHPPEGLLGRVREASTSNSEVLEFLATVLAPLDVTGADGLKRRSGLLEYRYDATT